MHVTVDIGDQQSRTTLAPGKTSRFSCNEHYDKCRGIIVAGTLDDIKGKSAKEESASTGVRATARAGSAQRTNQGKTYTSSAQCVAVGQSCEAKCAANPGLCHAQVCENVEFNCNYDLKHPANEAQLAKVFESMKALRRLQNGHKPATVNAPTSEPSRIVCNVHPGAVYDICVREGQNSRACSNKQYRYRAACPDAHKVYTTLNCPGGAPSCRR